MLRYFVILIPTLIYPATQPPAKVPHLTIKYKNQKYRRTWPARKDSPRPPVKSEAELEQEKKLAWIEEQRKKGCYCIQTDKGWECVIL